MPDPRIQAAVANWAPRFLAQGVDPNDFARVTAPKATLHGTRDTVVLPSMSDAIRDAHPTRLEGLGHLTWLEAPDAFTRAVRELTTRASRR